MSLSSPCKYPIEEFYVGGVTSARKGGYHLMINCIGKGQIGYDPKKLNDSELVLRLSNSLQGTPDKGQGKPLPNIHIF